MKIGIDAKWFFNGPPSGRIVVQNIIFQLANIKTEHEFYLFFDIKEKHQSFVSNNPMVHSVYIWAGNNLLSNLFVLPRHAKKLNIDAVFFQNFSSFRAKYKSIVYIHDVKFLSMPKYYSLIERLYFSPLRFLTRQADRACTVSEEEKKQLIKHQFRDHSNEIDVIHLGVNPMFQPLERYSADYVKGIMAKYHLPEKFLLFVGRLNPIKNVINLLKAIPLLEDEKIPLVIVGPIDRNALSYQKLIDGLNISDRVIFTGFSQGVELACIYSMAAIFCFPSYAESFGLPPLEAMACGIPVVVSNRTSLPEICGEAASYINPDNPQEIALAINSLLMDSSLYRVKKQKGLDRSKEFSWEISAKKVIASIERCVNGN